MKNTYTIKGLKKIIDIKETNVSDNNTYDYLRITSLKNKGLEDNDNNTLYFPITIPDDYIKNDWVTKQFDLRSYINNIVKDNKESTFVIEEDMKNSLLKGTKYIVVPNIMESIDLIYKDVIKKKKAKVIAITGSAGKTTCAGIIEDVLKTKYNTLRIFSDRITPLILETYIINYLTKDIDYVVLEMSIYNYDHVKILSDLLNPDIAVMLNIGSSHIGNKGIKNKKELCIGKSFIMKHAEVSYINGDDEYLNCLDLKDHNLYFNKELLFKTNLKSINRIYPEKAIIEGKSMVVNNDLITPNFLTDLTIMQYMTAYDIGVSSGISSRAIAKTLNNVLPIEKRLERINLFGKNIIFDGDSCFKERFHQMSLHKYKKCYLVIRKYGSDYYNDDFGGIKEYFKAFTKVYLFSDIAYLDDLKTEPNVVIVNNNDFIKDLDGEIIYHYHDYNYQFNKVEEENLK